MKKSTSRILVPVSVAVFILGIVIGGVSAWSLLITGRLANQTTSQDKNDSLKASEQNPSSSELSYFQEHYVNLGGNYARIPLKFCSATMNFNAECEIAQSFIEVDLRKHPLPVAEIWSAATDANTRIAFAKTSNNKREDGCLIPELYTYDHKGMFLNDEKGSFLKLKNDDSMWRCGAVGSSIESLSPGGRYIRIIAKGNTSAYGSWLYDIEKDIKDPQVIHSPFVTFISSGEANRDRYVLYLGGCEKEDLLSMFPECKQVLTLRDNESGKTIAITNVIDTLKKKGIAAENIIEASYSEGEDELYLSTGDLTKDLLVTGFKRSLKGIE